MLPVLEMKKKRCTISTATLQVKLAEAFYYGY